MLSLWRFFFPSQAVCGGDFVGIRVYVVRSDSDKQFCSVKLRRSYQAEVDLGK